MSQEEETREKADPMISVFDLEGALEEFFLELKHRNLMEFLGKLTQHNVTWKTAPKVVNNFRRVSMCC